MDPEEKKKGGWVQVLASPPPQNKAIVAFTHGRGYVLCFDVDETVEEASGIDHGESFALENIDVSVDYDAKNDGICIVDVSVEDDGPGDWPGSRECCICLKNARPVTKEEWAAFLDGEFPW